jgi:hypothetical protein
MVLSADEKSQIQALDRTQPGLPRRDRAIRHPQERRCKHDNARETRPRSRSVPLFLRKSILAWDEDKSLRFLSRIHYDPTEVRKRHVA